MLEGEHFSGASETRLNLVDNQQNPVLVADRAQFFQISGGGNDDAGLALNGLDQDGGGSADRKEMVIGLFALGVWLHPSESAALMEQLDSDGGGEIELEELKEFWDSYIFDGWK